MGTRAKNKGVEWANVFHSISYSRHVVHNGCQQRMARQKWDSLKSNNHCRNIEQCFVPRATLVGDSCHVVTNSWPFVTNSWGDSFWACRVVCRRPRNCLLFSTNPIGSRITNNESTGNHETNNCCCLEAMGLRSFVRSILSHSADSPKLFHRH